MITKNVQIDDIAIYYVGMVKFPHFEQNIVDILKSKQKIISVPENIIDILFEFEKEDDDNDHQIIIFDISENNYEVKGEEGFSKIFLK